MKITTKLLTIFFIIVLLGFATVLYNSQQKFAYVSAFGPLNVTFPSIPLFQETNWQSGKTVSKTVLFENTDSFVHKIGIKADNFSDSQNSGLSGGLSIVIFRDGNPIYGQGSQTGFRTLHDFYTEPVVWLGDLKAKDKTSIDIKVQMDLSAGNEFQGASTKFDLFAGIDNVFILPTLAPLPTLKPLAPIKRTLPTLKPLPTLPELPTLAPIRNL